MSGPPMPLDVVVFGGGASGLWLLDELVRGGFSALLLEADRLGAGQTACAQGIIHGGLKYSLDGIAGSSARALRDMPSVWSDCLAGRRAPDLGGTRVRARHCHLWRTGSVRSRLGMVAARIGLRASPQAVADDERPSVLRGCPGPVVRVAEPVIDPLSLLADLASRNRQRLLKVDPARLRLGAGRVELGDRLELAPRRIVFTAGAGNAGLCAAAGLGRAAVQQRRPLHMVMARGDLAELNGHCVDGARTRVTITSDTDRQGRTVWQLGGQIAEDGVEMEPRDLARRAAEEVRAVLPGADLAGVQWATYRIDRAEALSAAGRPDDVGLLLAGGVIAAWPTKLALVPRLVARVVKLLDAPAAGAAGVPPDWPRPDVADPPWETAAQWYDDP